MGAVGRSVAGGLGFEPELAESEPVVPLRIGLHEVAGASGEHRPQSKPQVVRHRFAWETVGGFGSAV
jgi:hypothetical protein